MSTRSSEFDSSSKRPYQFDHGCQAIFSPKTAEFRTELNRWKDLGWVKKWRGNFGTIRLADTNNDKFIFEQMKEEDRYVGYPRMNSICEHLLKTQSDVSTIEVLTQTRAAATHLSSTQYGGSCMWQLHKGDNKFQVLGNYDWLICTDRNSAKADLRDANVQSFNDLANQSVGSIPICTTMVILDRPLPIPIDGVQIDYESYPDLICGKFGTLGWIARDSSKPGRQQFNGKTEECWVIQSSEQEGKRLLGSKGLKDESLVNIREGIRRAMVEDFEKSLPLLVELANADSDTDNFAIPSVIQSIGHRWGAAFPKHIGAANAFKTMDCSVDTEKQFIACGDYFGNYHGSVEGAYLSGRAAANQLIEHAGTDFSIS
jgi:predicted NAD/FAD-dependent oxidoreductase